MRPHIILDKAQPNFLDPAGDGRVVMGQVFDAIEGAAALVRAAAGWARAARRSDSGEAGEQVLSGGSVVDRRLAQDVGLLRPGLAPALEAEEHERAVRR